MPRSSIAPGISRPERTVPELLTVAFEAKDGMIRAPASGFGIVTTTCALLMAVERQNDGIEMEHQRASGWGSETNRGEGGRGHEPIDEWTRVRVVVESGAKSIHREICLGR